MLGTSIIDRREQNLCLLTVKTMSSNKSVEVWANYYVNIEDVYKHRPPNCITVTFPTAIKITN